MNKYNQLCIEQRETIQHLISTWNANKENEIALKKVKSFTQIGKAIGTDRTTVSKEVRRNRYIKTTTPFNQNQIEKAEEACPRLQEPPYVCNNCLNVGYCAKHKVYYNATEAQKRADTIKKESREGVDITPETIDEIEHIIVPLIKNKKHSINQVYTNHPDILYVCKATFYKYVNEGILSLKNIDLPKKVKYKKRKKKQYNDNRRALALLVGRIYTDFCIYIVRHPKMNIYEMDTVIGRITDTKAILTIYFRETHFMIIRLLNKKNVFNVNAEFDRFKKKLGIKLYAKVFRIGLTDNGSEFFDPYFIERDYDRNVKITNLFYCDPGCPGQKGGIEKNHEFIRKVLPKGTSFDNLTQEQISRLENQINNIPRDSLNGKTPYKLMKEKYPDFIDKLGYYYISPDEVDMSIESILGK